MVNEILASKLSMPKYVLQSYPAYFILSLIIAKSM